MKTRNSNKRGQTESMYIATSNSKQTSNKKDSNQEQLISFDKSKQSNEVTKQNREPAIKKRGRKPKVKALEINTAAAANTDQISNENSTNDVNDKKLMMRTTMKTTMKTIMRRRMRRRM